MDREDADLHRTQRAFRSILDAFARPGTLHSIEPSANNPARPAALDALLESVTRLFVDQAVTFGVADVESDALVTYVASETHASCVSLCDAQFLIVPARADARTVHEAISEANQGTLLAPEKGATLLVGCAYLAEVAQGTVVSDQTLLSVVEVRGPGVEDTNRFAVDRIEWARARAARGDEFPSGIEIVLVDTAGRVVAIPRSSQLRWNEAAPLEEVR